MALFHSMEHFKSRMPKKTRLFIRLEAAKDKSADVYDNLLAIMQDRSKVDVHWL